MIARVRRRLHGDDGLTLLDVVLILAAIALVIFIVSRLH
jgi:hypothetical protein